MGDCRNVKYKRNLLASAILTVLCATRMTVQESKIQDRPSIPIPNLKLWHIATRFPAVSVLEMERLSKFLLERTQWI